MKLSIVAPVYNEEGNLRPLHARIQAVAVANADDYEIVFVDDGSTDGSLTVMQDLCRRDPHVRYVSFSRNFGHEIATTAGLDRTSGDAVVLIDADLQDPPEVITDLIAEWERGVDVAYARRRRRQGESAFRKFTAWLFYRILRRLSEVDIPADTGDFRLMDRRVVEVIRQCREDPRFIRGLVGWAGFRQEAVLYDRVERHAGKTKYDIKKLVRLSWQVICASSLAPLRLAMWIGIPLTLLSVVSIVIAIVRWLASGVPVSPYIWLACAMFLLGGVGLTMLGILAQYLGQIFRFTRNRPLYVVHREGGWARSAEQVLDQPQAASRSAKRSTITPPLQSLTPNPQSPILNS